MGCFVPQFKGGGQLISDLSMQSSAALCFC